MNFLVLCLLCLVQAFTEFLPISSSGHLLLLEQIFKIDGDLLSLNLFLHLATLLAVIIFYRKTIVGLIKKPIQPLTAKLIVSTAITAVIAIVYKLTDFDTIATKIYGYCFLATSIILFLSFKFQQKSVCVKTGELSYKSAVVVGVAQGFAVLPGLSRSGTTISTLLFCGENETESAEYSFLISIPIIVGGFLIELLSAENVGSAFSALSVWECLFAFFFTFLMSLLSLKITISALKNNKFVYFSLYLLLLSLVVIIFV